MATSQTATITCTYTVNSLKTLATGNATQKLSDTASVSLADGTSTSAAEARKTHIGGGASTIAGSGTVSFDLSGSLTDIWGDANVWTKLKAVYILHEPTSAASGITVSGNLADAIWGGTNSQPLAPGDFTVRTRQIAGITVTNTSADTITLTNNDSGNAATYLFMASGL